VYERKIIYTGKLSPYKITRFPLLTNSNLVDDGTGVVDCNHLHRPSSKITPKYAPIDVKSPLEPLNPVTEIGRTVRVIGSVRLQYHTRVISIDQIGWVAFHLSFRGLNYSQISVFLQTKNSCIPDLSWNSAEQTTHLRNHLWYPSELIYRHTIAHSKPSPFLARS
jgi:hypothetical protein